MSVVHLIQQLIHAAPRGASPIFLVGAPRAGTTVLARMLVKAERARLASVEAHERAEALIAERRGALSDRLTHAAATPEITAQLRAILLSDSRARLIDQVGANALRIPFLASTFPDARFVFVAHRPRDQVARMIAAWRSGQYVTYPSLPGWDGPWSLPLIPGWEALRGRSQAEIAAAQWATITDIALADLAALPAERWCAVSYEALRADLHGTLQRVGHLSGLRWRSVPRTSELGGSVGHAIPTDLEEADALLVRASETVQRLHEMLQRQIAERPDGLRAPQRLPRRLRRTIATGTVAASLFGASLAPAQVARAATFTVTNLNDSGAGSLRQAIDDANGAAGADTITFQPGLTGTITLTTGQLSITDSVEIQGPGASTLSVSGNNASRVFYLYNGSSNIAVTISGLTVTGGRSTIGAGIINFDEDLTLDGVTITGNAASNDGGGLWADGFTMDLTIRDSTISGNTSGNDGGGIYVEDTGGPLLIQRTVISGNTATGSGGGIYFYDPDNDLTIEDSAITGNTAGTTGGGVYFYSLDNGTTTIRGTTISGNSAASGGGIYFYGADKPMVIENSTISGNQATSGSGGGIAFYAVDGSIVEVRHSTIAGNSASGGGGGIFVEIGTLPVDHTIVADNTATSNPDLSGEFALSFSLVEAPGSASIANNGGNILSQDPVLGALADNGGATQTQLPADTSPVVNAGDAAFAPPPTVDQRGLARVINGQIDMGAVERNAGTLQLAATTLSVSEGGGSATVTASRTGGSDGAVSVDFASADGTALAGSDFTAAGGTLSWASGDLADKIITVPLADDSEVEADETLTVTISNSQGGATLGTAAIATITILDNEASSYQVFLPDVAYQLLPDLAVTSVTLTPNQTTFQAGAPVEVAITVTNQGTATTSPFWVDMYLNPSAEPTVNQTWNLLCQLTPCYGVAWGVTTPLAPGESIILRTTVDSYAAGQTFWEGTFASGTTRLVVLADSYNPASSAGNLVESNEANNTASVSLIVTGVNPAGAPITPALPALPERPAQP